MRNTVLKYLKNSADNFPDKIAVIDDKGSLTYSELSANSADIAEYIYGVASHGSPVIVFMEKSIYAVSSFWGAAFAGCCYSLFNPELPEKRLLQMKEVLKSEVVITDKSHELSAKKLFNGTKICLVEDIINSGERRQAEINVNIIDTDPLYVNFTSGSTGIPKAVAVSHRSAVDFIDVFTDLFEINDNDIIGNQAPLDFDVSVKDIYSAAKTGAELVLIPKQLFSAPVNLLDYICEHKVTTMIWAVSALCLITTFHGLDYKTPETVKRVLFSGEVMPMKHLKCWLDHLPDATFVNLYGPTEITCNCTYHIIDRSRDYSGGIPIGKAFPNERILLIDSQGNMIDAPDTAGEICISGTALALGYYNNTEQTDKAFIQNPCNKYYYERIYRTGDIGKFNERGELYFCGRLDNQIKHMGHRIELEEIEKAVGLCAGVERCGCIFDQSRDKLYCFYVGEAQKSEIYAELKDKLPIFMIPGAFRKLDEMPITKNGKIDRNALSEYTLKRKEKRE